MKKFIFILYALVSINVVSAQSYHFSQFFSTPLLTNPANTGFTEGPYRFASNIRTQGTSGNTFFTGYVSADVSALRNHLPLGSKAGLGMYIMNDHSLNSAIQNNTIGLSAAYSVGLDPYGENSFGLGIQATYTQRKIDYSKLNFESQFGPSGFDPSLPVGEPLDYSSKQAFDVNAGVNYNWMVDDKSVFAGISVYNILSHNENLVGDEYKLPRRFTFQAGAQLPINDYGNIYTSLTAISQAKANEVTFGGAVGIKLPTTADKSELLGGVWYRLGDALIPYIGYQRNSFQVGLSYDYTVSALRTSAQIKNGYELTLIYKAPDKRQLKTYIPWY